LRSRTAASLLNLSSDRGQADIASSELGRTLLSTAPGATFGLLGTGLVLPRVSGSPLLASLVGLCLAPAVDPATVLLLILNNLRYPCEATTPKVPSIRVSVRLRCVEIAKVPAGEARYIRTHSG
jgi:hypothetical protein